MERNESLRRRNSFDGGLVFGQSAFTKKTGRDEHLANRATDIQFYIDPGAGLLKEEYSLYRSCPLCGFGVNETLFVKGGFNHVRCAECGFVFVNPVASESLRNSYFSAETSWVRVLESSEQIKMDKLKFSYGLDIAEEYISKRGRMLDAGCGGGVFLDIARNRGWEVVGLEFNKRDLKELERKGIPFIDSPLEETKIEEASFDCVSSWEVLEHINDPLAHLSTLVRILKPGGILIVCVPNLKSLATSILHEKAGTFQGMSHVNFFSACSLERLMIVAGLETVLMETIISEIGAIRNYLNFDDPYVGDGECPEWLTPAFIHDNMLGSRLLAIARKKR